MTAWTLPALKGSFEYQKTVGADQVKGMDLDIIITSCAHVIQVCEWPQAPRLYYIAGICLYAKKGRQGKTSCSMSPKCLISSQISSLRKSVIYKIIWLTFCAENANRTRLTLFFMLPRIFPLLNIKLKRRFSQSYIISRRSFLQLGHK
jgi:hypothetical protein